jgi:hypothetical protein
MRNRQVPSVRSAAPVVTLALVCLVTILVVVGTTGCPPKPAAPPQATAPMPPPLPPPPAVSQTPTTVAKAPSPETPAADKPTVQPSEEKAKAKALAESDKTWVTKVVKHSDDWSTATIDVGPPASEWAGEFDLKWNGSDYDVVAKRALEGP